MRKLLSLAASLTLAAGLFVAAIASPAGAATTTVYDATPNPLPPNVASLGFQATSTSEFGDLVTLGGTERTLDSVTVTMSDWALFSDYATDIRYSGDSTSWTHPITVNVYDDALDVNGVPATLLASTTETIAIPWRPVADPTCTTTTAWRAGDGLCYNGLAFNATFDMTSASVSLPNEVIVGVEYNTQSYGDAPIGSPGPYNSLNVGVPSGQVPTVGTDANADNVFWNTSHAPFYTDGGTDGVGTFREDTNWTPNGTVAFKVEATSLADLSIRLKGEAGRFDPVTFQRAGSSTDARASWTNKAFLDGKHSMLLEKTTNDRLAYAAAIVDGVEGTSVASLGDLAFSFTGVCSGGSPRFNLFFDSDGDGEANGVAFLGCNNVTLTPAGKPGWQTATFPASLVLAGGVAGACYDFNPAGPCSISGTSTVTSLSVLIDIVGTHNIDRVTVGDNVTGEPNGS
jgi:hypothetical protein